MQSLPPHQRDKLFLPVLAPAPAPDMACNCVDMYVRNMCRLNQPSPEGQIICRRPSHLPCDLSVSATRDE